MKRLLSLFSFLFLMITANAQTAAAPLEWKETSFDFGSIPQGKPVYHTFQVINKSNAPLQVDNVQASCGCTTPEWSKEPVAPGAATTIRVGYNAAAEGPFEKSVTVTYNGNNTKQIIIKGSVWRTPAGPAPTNASINFLKQQTQ